MKAALIAWYRTRQFDPRVVGLLINPFFLARRRLHKAIAERSVELHGRRLLDVGCGTKPYRKLFDVTEYLGLDIDSEITRRRGIADVLYDGGKFPFADARFEAVLCNQVLEHVFNPDEFVSELARVLAPGGRLLLTVPFIWDEHEQPWDYARYTSFGLRHILERHGLRVLRHDKLLDDLSALAQLFNAYLFKILSARSPRIALAVTPLVMAPVSLLGLLAGWLFPRNPDLFLDHVVVAERIL
jgi:SAM-dependent methyltransferase